MGPPRYGFGESSSSLWSPMSWPTAPTTDGDRPHRRRRRTRTIVRAVGVVAVVLWISTNGWVGMVLVSDPDVPSSASLGAAIVTIRSMDHAEEWASAGGPIHHPRRSHRRSSSPHTPGRHPTHWDAVDAAAQVRTEARRRRTRPIVPPPPPSSSSNLGTGSLGEADDRLVRTLRVEDSSLRDTDARNKSVLCQAAGLHERSRLVVWGVLSQPPAPAFLLFAAKYCHVRVVLGVDLLFPNHSWTRAEQMNDHRHLKRSLDDLRLLVPPHTLEAPQYDEVVQTIVDFAPTHVLSVMTVPPPLESIMTEPNGRYYAIRSGLLSLHTLLRAMAQLQPSSSTISFLQVTSADSQQSPWVRLPMVLVRTMANVPVTQLELPAMYGPMVTPHLPEDPPPQNNGRSLYVDDAVTAMLLGLSPDAPPRIVVEHSQSADPVVEATHTNETRAWWDSLVTPHLGTAMMEGHFVENYGIHRTRFPCASKCPSLQCRPTVWDSIRNVTRTVTEGCRAVLYMANFSKTLDDLPEMEPSAQTASKSSVICRVAFISIQSRFMESVRKEVRNQYEIIAKDTETSDHNGTHNQEQKGPSDEELMAMSNGLRLDGWICVWVDHDESTIPDLDISFLQIDPGAIFAKSVDRALFANSLHFTQANNVRLQRLFRQIWASRQTLRSQNQFQRQSNTLSTAKMDAYGKRRAILFTREPDEEVDFESFIAHAKHISPQQQQFYQESAKLLTSTEGRTEQELLEGYWDKFPFQWITPTFILHELAMSTSQEFRCDWLREVLFWDSKGSDASLLSFAYLMGKRIVEKRISRRLEDQLDGSWFAVFDENSDGPIKNRRGEEIYVRVVPRNVNED